MTANEANAAAGPADPGGASGTKNGTGVIGSGKTTAAPHPLGPLTGAEITQSSDLIRAQWPEGTGFQFKVVTLLEPVKDELVPYLDAERAGQTPRPIDRKSQVVYYLRKTVSSSLLSHIRRR